MSKRCTIEECDVKAKIKNGNCFEIAYINNKIKMTWKCDNIHHNPFKMIYSNVIRGQWCKECAKETRSVKKRMKEKDFLKMLNEKNFILLSSFKNYTNKNNIVEVRCSVCNYIIKSSVYSVLLNGCKDCSRRKLSIERRRSLEEVLGIIKQKNIEIINIYNYKNRSSVFYVSCNKCKNTWESKVENLINKGCRFCNKNGGVRQKKLTNIIKKICHTLLVSNYKGFDWLKTDLNKLEIDIWVPKLKLAIEYDGEQHFIPIKFGGISDEKAEKNLKKQKERDTLKNELIAKHQEEIKYFVRFNYKEKINEEYVIEKLKKAGIILGELKWQQI